MGAPLSALAAPLLLPFVAEALGGPPGLYGVVVFVDQNNSLLRKCTQHALSALTQHVLRLAERSVGRVLLT